MTIVPSGNPLWLRNSGITQYGGDINKKDFGGIGVINARTDLSAAQYSRLAADQAAVARVASLMRLVFVTGTGTAAVSLCSPAWGAPATYADGSTPPSANYPTVTGTGTSRTVTLPASVADDYGVVADLAPQIVFVTGGKWDGTITSNAFVITNITDAEPVSLTIW